MAWNASDDDGWRMHAWDVRVKANDEGLDVDCRSIDAICGLPMKAWMLNADFVAIDGGLDSECRSMHY